MQTLLLWLLALYGVATLWIQIRKWLSHSRKQTSIHYYVYTYNSQGKIEWMLRYLAQLAWLEGRAFRFSVYDFGSSDDTLAIIKYLQKDGFMIELFPYSPETTHHDFPPQQHDRNKQLKYTCDRNKQLKYTNDTAIVVDLRESTEAVPCCG